MILLRTNFSSGPLPVDPADHKTAVFTDDNASNQLQCRVLQHDITTNHKVTRHTRGCKHYVAPKQSVERIKKKFERTTTAVDYSNNTHMQCYPRGTMEKLCEQIMRALCPIYVKFFVHIYATLLTQGTGGRTDNARDKLMAW